MTMAACSRSSLAASWLFNSWLLCQPSGNTPGPPSPLRSEPACARTLGMKRKHDAQVAALQSASRCPPQASRLHPCPLRPSRPSTQCTMSPPWQTCQAPVMEASCLLSLCCSQVASQATRSSHHSILPAPAAQRTSAARRQAAAMHRISRACWHFQQTAAMLSASMLSGGQSWAATRCLPAGPMLHETASPRQLQWCS